MASRGPCREAPRRRPFRDAARAGRGRESIQDVAAPRFESLPEPGEQPATDGVDHDVRLGLRRRGDARPRRRTGLGGAELETEGELLPRSRRGPGPSRPRSLRSCSRRRADTSGRGGDHDAIAGGDLRAMARVPGGEEVTATAAASTRSIPSGSGKTRFAGTATFSAWPPKMGRATTRCPGARPRDAGTRPPRPFPRSPSPGRRAASASAGSLPSARRGPRSSDRSRPCARGPRPTAGSGSGRSRSTSRSGPP